MNVLEGVTLIVIILIGLLLGVITAQGEMSITEFLIEDQTDVKMHTNIYTCGHFVRDLARNASDINLTIGGLILGDHSRLYGFDNHAMNFIRVNGTIMVIEPQTDQIMSLEATGYEYYRIYENGEYTPSFWNYAGRVNKI